MSELHNTILDLRARLEAAEGERDQAKAEVRAMEQEARVAHRDVRDAEQEQVALRGERDRLREERATFWDVAVKAVSYYIWNYSTDHEEGEADWRAEAEQILEPLRAALSTGDRQDDDSHVRTAEATQPAQARPETGGGAS